MDAYHPHCNHPVDVVITGAVQQVAGECLLKLVHLLKGEGEGKQRQTGSHSHPPLGQPFLFLVFGAGWGWGGGGAEL